MKLTNADRIRNMTDDELADFLLKVNCAYSEPCMTGKKPCKWENYPTRDKGCKDCFLAWLGKERDEKMSNDLISRSEVLKVLEYVFNKYNMTWNKYGGGGFAKEVPEAIEAIPTAYDVDKVVEQLEKEKEQSYYYSTLKGGRANGKSIVYGKNLAYQRAIEIVKAGGID